MSWDRWRTKGLVGEWYLASTLLHLSNCREPAWRGTNQTRRWTHRGRTPKPAISNRRRKPKTNEIFVGKSSGRPSRSPKSLENNDLLLEKAAGPLPGAGPACFVINNVSRILFGHEIFSLRRARGFLQIPPSAEPIKCPSRHSPRPSTS